MANSQEVLTRTDALVSSINDKVNAGGFQSFRDYMRGLLFDLIGARQRFAYAYPQPVDKPGFSAIVAAVATAQGRTDALQPTNASVAQWGASVETVISALNSAAASARGSFLQGALRVRGAAAPAGAAAGFGSPNLKSLAADDDGPPPTRSTAAPAREPEPYVQSLVKLFPVEAVTAYPMAVNIAGDDPAMLRILVGVLALFVLAIRYLATKPVGGGSPDWGSMIVALISFLLYAGALGAYGVILRDASTTNQLIAFITVLWVAIVPHFVRQANPAPQPAP